MEKHYDVLGVFYEIITKDGDVPLNDAVFVVAVVE